MVHLKSPKDRLTMCRMQSKQFEKMVFADGPSRRDSEILLTRMLDAFFCQVWNYVERTKKVRSATLARLKLKMIGAACLKSMKCLGHLHDVFGKWDLSLYTQTPSFIKSVSLSGPAMGVGCYLVATHGVCIFSQAPSR